MKFFFFSFLTTVSLLVACNNKLKVDKNGFNLNESFPIQINETVKMNSGNLQLTLTDIPEDSRCPEDANCIWEGQVRMFLDASVPTNKKSIEFKIEKSKMGKVKKDFENYTILVENVLPVNKSGIRIPKENYVVTLNVMPK